MKRFEGDISKLPKWAQRDIQVLEANLRSARRKLKEIAGEGETEVYLQQHMENDIPLPAGSQIRFMVPGRGQPNDRHHIDARVEGDGLRLYGSRCVEIRPGSANNILIVLED